MFDARAGMRALGDLDSDDVDPAGAVDGLSRKHGVFLTDISQMHSRIGPFRDEVAG
jgi:hypothetical protein